MSKEETIILQDFIFNDKVQNILSEINDNVMDFNILEITGMGTQEIKHSNILGWLFDDSEHNLEYQILNNFLKRVIKEKGNCNDGLQSYLYLSNKKRDISVYREKDNIDLLIVDEANKIVISIENKIYANERIEGEDGGQLQKYENILNEKYHNYDKYYIFLTIDFEYPSEENEHWLRANYQIIVDTLEEILKIKETTTKTKIILESYIDLLKRNGIVGKKELQQLCEKIWNNKQYANAIDILMKYRITPIQKIYEMLKEELKFYRDSNCLELDGIKKLYGMLDKNEEEEWGFDIMLNYYGGKNEHIWFGFYHPDLKEFDESFQNICRRITNKKSKKITKETVMFKIDRKYVGDRGVDIVVKEIVDKVNQVNKRILTVINE